MKIQNINRATNKSNGWCGPAVISSITGCTTDEAAKVIQEIRGNSRQVVGVDHTDLCEAFKRLGYNTTYYTHLARAGNLFYVLSILSDGVYVIIVPGHYICIEVDGPRRYICDNHTKKPLNASISSRGMQRVMMVIGVEKHEN